MSDHEIFEKALAIGDPADRARFLAQACGEDSKLREKIERELKRGFYELPRSEGDAATAVFARNHKQQAI